MGNRGDRHRDRRAPPAAVAALTALAPSHLYQRRDRRPHIAYFNARPDYLQKTFPVGARLVVSGTVVLYDGMLQMVHPERVIAEADIAKLPLVEPVYPLTEGLSLNQVRRAVAAALARIPFLPEWQDEAFINVFRPLVS